jgi:hypothetical protein
MCVVFTTSSVVAGFVSCQVTYLMSILHRFWIDLCSFGTTQFDTIHCYSVSSMPCRTSLLPHHCCVTHVCRTIVWLPLIFIQEWYKLRGPSLNQSFQRSVMGHKRGYEVISTKKITNNNNVWTWNINQLWDTTCTSVLQEFHQKPFSPTMFTGRCCPTTSSNLVLYSLNIKSSWVHTSCMSIISLNI